MASIAKNYGLGQFITGVVLAILFGILAGATSGGNKPAYIGAAIVCGIAAAVGLIIFLVKK